MRRIPQVDKLLRHPLLVEVQTRFRRDLLTILIREEFDRLRRAGETDVERLEQTEAAEQKQAAGAEVADLDELARQILLRVDSLCKPGMRRVINGTGIVLHTNLGRAPLSRLGIEQLDDLADGYVNLEIDLQTGERGKRSEHVSTLLRLITGAEEAVCVNNNAAAVVLCVNTLAQDKEVIVSRGELIEIGGSFRLPEVITAGGARLREVGTTNRTRAADYDKAINQSTGLIIRCHRSNFDISGFTEQPTLADIVAVGNKHSVAVLEDLGSGVLCDMAAISAFRNEPSVREVVSSGCDIVCFSGDKLLGGPQAGIIVGRKPLIDRLAKNPLYRALRLDKVAMRLLETTLRAYLSPHPEQFLPALAMLGEAPEEVRARAQRFAAQLSVDVVSEVGSGVLNLTVIDCLSAAGGGSLPGQEIASSGLSVEVTGMKAGQLAQSLRQAEIPVIGVLKDGVFFLDFRTVPEGDQKALRTSLLAVLPKLPGRSQTN